MFVFFVLVIVILLSVYEIKIFKKNYILKLFLCFIELFNLYLLYINYLNYMVEGCKIISVFI